MSVRAEPFTFSMPGLYAAGPAEYLDTPTIEVGDVRVSKDGGPYVNIDTLPVAGTDKTLSVSLTSTEMDAAAVNIRFSDPQKEWEDVTVQVATTPAAEPTLEYQQAILNRLTDCQHTLQITSIGAPIKNGTLQLMANKDYVESNSNQLVIPVPQVAGLATAEEALLTIRSLSDKTITVERLASVEIDADIGEVKFDVDSAQLSYATGDCYEFMIELRHGAQYQAIMIGQHELLADIADPGSS